ncbi:TraR/DksA family transcriptional regulator [Roseovarius sp. S4756]|uniref:TraR/DksA family transcriptional regulator n=1 Tax=Roseovarius maritimus TaxID=3342637 RepID=UPI00372A8D09
MDIAKRETTLRERRAELTKHLETVEHTLDEVQPKDWEDRSSERQGDEVLESLGQAELAEVRRIDAALDRIKAGTYGVCQSCGEDISTARLDLLPATPFCKNCAT